MIYVRGLSKRFGPDELFQEVTLELVPGQRYGLVGANGSGKSTFLRILTGDEPHDDGDVMFATGLRLGVLRQDQFANDDERILDVAMRGDEEVYAALAELEADAQGAIDHERAAHLAELGELVARHDGYTLETRAKQILTGLGIAEGDLMRPLSILSGGYKLRVLLAQVLVGRPGALLLDEPTNHLDILSIRWLEGFLSNYEGTVLVISHDRHFLDRTTTRTLDVDYGTISEYPGNYSKFVVHKEVARLQREAEIERSEKIIAEKKAFVERFGAKATKARQAQSRLKQIERIEVKEVQRTSRRAPLFRFNEAKKSGKDVLTVEGLSKSFGEKRVLEDLHMFVRRGERIGIIGENGIGKSTLLKLLTDHLAADSGRFAWGAGIEIGYFAQDHRELLADPKLTPLEYVYSAVPDETVSFVRGELGRMLFSGEDVDKKVTNLSGGEAARLVFARINVQKPNVLLLDEPTNHLDLESIEALSDALVNYTGTVLFVSHDRYFVSRVATRIVELTRNGSTDFPGTFDEYLEKKGQDHLDADVALLRAKVEKTAPQRASDERNLEGELSYEERKRRANRQKSLPRKRDELLDAIDRLETRKAELEAQQAAPPFYTSTPLEEQGRVHQELAQLEQEVAQLLAQWEAVELELSELSG